MHMGRPVTVWRTGVAACREAIVYNEAGWPYLVGGDGGAELVIPCPPQAVQPEHEVPGWYDDYGYGFRTWPADLDGDGEEELLVHDRRFAWIFKRRTAAKSAGSPPVDDHVAHPLRARSMGRGA
jgi:hypothetical protein